MLLFGEKWDVVLLSSSPLLMLPILPESNHQGQGKRPYPRGFIAKMILQNVNFIVVLMRCEWDTQGILSAEGCLVLSVPDLPSRVS